MKKRLIIIIGVILVVVLIMILLYFYGLTAVSKEDKVVAFSISSGEGKTEIIDKLDEKGLKYQLIFM